MNKNKETKYQQVVINDTLKKALNGAILPDIEVSKGTNPKDGRRGQNGFKKGTPKHENSGRKRGQVAPRVAFWHVFADNIMNEGTEKAWNEIMKLEGTQYLSAYIMLLEYFKPKLGRIESVNTNIDIPVVQIVAPNQLPAMPSNLDDIEDVGHEEVK